MIEIQVDETHIESNINHVFVFDSYDSFITHIYQEINNKDNIDFHAVEYEVMKAILNKGYCKLNICDITYNIIVRIDGIMSMYNHI